MTIQNELLHKKNVQNELLYKKILPIKKFIMTCRCATYSDKKILC